MAAIAHGADLTRGAAAYLLNRHVGIGIKGLRGQVAVKHYRSGNQCGVFPEVTRAAQAHDRGLETDGEVVDHPGCQLATVVEDQVRARLLERGAQPTVGRQYQLLEDRRAGLHLPRGKKGRTGRRLAYQHGPRSMLELVPHRCEHH